MDFGIVSADEVVLARSHGNDVVALFAVFQDSPAGIMALTGIGDVLKEGTIALQNGLPFARLLERKFGFRHVKVVPSPGQKPRPFTSAATDRTVRLMHRNSCRFACRL